mmetsp:Transcript_49328/g.56889  ORF Transcript_49328/g.56889 Transcript_49328/m.56889 type:complete len:113 (-) Transcript_49328:244-582(-)|eukprot:CAMPEP_0170796728 /NCGR_PEP_ID=MMETSP0733-20121128/25080_1 /TAXON_ID=186038 /ORGANISM="Fragilariopsis kerguelensis, Strain L26-C5" /LENGTH=112 /DNA_ID=CAMNT_0011147239 /DNA_START=87 /DNA_END=425 /DNA_ORIENTATION=+
MVSFTGIGEFTKERSNTLFESHKKYLEWRKSEWASRGEAALAKRTIARAHTHKTWRQMKGFQLLAHEMNHPGNKPFVIGAGVMSVIYLWAFMGQSDEYRAKSEYWSKYHLKK